MRRAGSPRQPAETVASLLRGLPDVQSVEIEPLGEASTRYAVVPRDGGPIAGLLGNVVRDNGWTVEEMRVEHGRFDEVFRQATQAQRS